MYLGELGERSGNTFWWYLQELMAAGYKTIRSKYLLWCGGGSGGGGGGFLNLTLEPKLNKSEKGGKGGVQILGI